MDRRQFLLAVPSGALLVASASAQAPGRLNRIAFITPSEATIAWCRKFQLPELARLGFIEGRNLTLTTHVGPPARMPELAREAIATKPDVVIAVSTVAILAAKEASSTVPIVMSFIGEDPIEKGVANSFARPGGSVTGVAMLAAEMDGKRASLLHDFVVIISAPDFFRDAALLSRLALEARLPTVCEWASMAHDGCLIGYGPNFAELWRLPADYIARILRGEKPGELPIEQPTLFEFAVNLKTAKTLDLTIPEAALQRADEVIE
jgi:putative ABC transport system substrate-binding protein